MQYSSQSEIIREYLKRLFKQKSDVEKSDIPIYVNYSVPFYEIDKKRIMVYDENTMAPRTFLGDNEILRVQGFSVVVADNNSKVAYDRANSIMEYLTAINQDGNIVTIRAISDIEYLGINPKKYFLYSCDYSITRLK